MPPPIAASISTGLTITNPLVLYRALLATKRIDPDPAQHRLALELQKLYYKLKDYSPHVDYGARIKAISRVVEKSTQSSNNQEAAVPGHGLRRNPLFAKLFTGKQERDTLALTKVFTDHEAAMKLDSPKGMLLHGEVGCGKSMLLDILADSLPNKKKRRWHFNTFMLETLAQLEALRVDRLRLGSGVDFEHSLLWLAKDLIDKSPILFLDEFQLPDRAASKILSNLFTTFFQLGGVLVASSNRLPDELAKASGFDYAAPQRGSVIDFGRPKMSSFPANKEYSEFVDVLKARCEIYDLTGRDWRRREAEEVDGETASVVEAMREEMVEDFAKLESLGEQQVLDSTVFKRHIDLEALRRVANIDKLVLPRFYFLEASPQDSWEGVVRSVASVGVDTEVSWQSVTLLVYGRQVSVPRSYEGVCHWTFEELCEGSFGPADYITLASTFHTVIIDSVPVLTVLQKNEARRLITLLDALYEARCKLVMRAEAGPDDLFFPEARSTVLESTKAVDESKTSNESNDDAVYPETLSEIYQDQTSPFRPNISAYTDTSRNGYDPDEDSDFGPIPGKGNEIGRQVDFGMTSSFTGEDEKFAYKRARSRLWQLCSASWNARSEPGWWNPVPIEVRRWERPAGKTPSIQDWTELNSDVRMGESVDLDGPAGLQGKEMAEKKLAEQTVKSPFKEERAPPSKIGWTHAWGMIRWGKKAGAWGQGVDGLKDRKENK